MKKAVAFILTLAMIMALVACGGSALAADKVLVTIFNSKMEIQSQMEEMAEEWNDAHDDVEIEVYYSSDTVAAHMSTKYASNPPTRWQPTCPPSTPPRIPMSSPWSTPRTSTPSGPSMPLI